MDVQSALAIVDDAIAGIDEFDAVYRNASDVEGPQFRRYWDESLQIEATVVRPRLELARQIAAHVGAEELPVDAAPDKAM